MLRQGSGAAVHAVDDARTPITRSSDTWSTPQLCSGCETLMNDEWDRYGIAVFKGRIGTVRSTPAGVTLSGIDSGRLRMFVLAVLWRMSTSLHAAYLNAQLPVVIKEELRRTLLTKKRFSGSFLQVTLQRLHDSTAEGFSRESFRDVAMAPFVRSGSDCNAIGFLMFGFLVRIFVPSVPFRLRRSSHLVASAGYLVFAPRLEFVDFPELFDLGVRSLYKIDAGLSEVV